MSPIWQFRINFDDLDGIEKKLFLALSDVPADGDWWDNLIGRDLTDEEIASARIWCAPLVELVEAD